jgi:hypothetical protein
VANTASDRFAKLDLHDSELLGVFFHSTSAQGTAQLELKIGLLVGTHPDYSVKGARLVFHNVIGVQGSIDAATLAECAYAITETASASDSNFTTALGAEARKSEAGLDEAFVEFSIELCPPSGVLRIVASDFELVEQEAD